MQSSRTRSRRRPALLRAMLLRAALIRAIGFAGAIGPIALGGCDRGPTGPAPASAPDAIRGVTLGDWTELGIASEAGMDALDEISAAGATAVVFVSTIWQSDPGASGFDPGRPVCPESGSLATAAARARHLGLDVILKLHVDLADGSWRARIDPPDPTAWFAAYGEHVARCAEAAALAGARQLVVGTELAGTIRHEARWREVIAIARSRFVGEIVYAASWDEAESVPFWDAVDLVGVDFWYPVTVRPDAGRHEMLAGWQPWLGRLERLHRRTGRPVLLTEIGYRSVDGAGMRPAAWTTGGTPDLREQSDLYWAALAAVAGEPWIRGIYWWNWEVSSPGGATDTGYTPCAKPALEVLRSAWTGGRS